MAGIRTTIVTILMCILIIISCTDAKKRKSRRTKRNHMTCRPRSLVRYQMTVHTTWDKETFPKMYPTYRPPAHWSQLIGRSHGNNYRMWQEGDNASLAVQKFAEKENAEFFDLELSQGYNGVLDAFVAPTIETSVGQTSTVVSLDGRHSKVYNNVALRTKILFDDDTTCEGCVYWVFTKAQCPVSITCMANFDKVSFMMKIVPSPDWFVGIDSTELCYRGKWRKTYSRDLRPFDAGTDQGLTFTSPRWPNVPREVISPITSSSPDHPASSFFYPEYKVLPRLAYVDFEMISEYRLRKVHKKIEQIPQQNVSGGMNIPSASQKTTEVENVFKNNEDGVISVKTPSFSTNGRTSEDRTDSSSHLNTNRNSLFSLISEPEEKVTSSLGTTEDSETTARSKPNHHHSKPAIEMRSLSVSETSNSKRNPEKQSMQPQGRHKPAEFTTSEGGEGKQKDQSDYSMQKSRVAAERLTPDKLKGYQQRVDCQLSEWSEWSSCSQTCGFGNKQRSREVITMPRHGGAHCPLLTEETLCGSMRNCQWKHFSLMDGSRKRNSPFKTLKRRIVRRRRKH